PGAKRSRSPCGAPSQGPPVASISIVRETPMAPSLRHCFDASDAATGGPESLGTPLGEGSMTAVGGGNAATLACLFGEAIFMATRARPPASPMAMAVVQQIIRRNIMHLSMMALCQSQMLTTPQ